MDDHGGHWTESNKKSKQEDEVVDDEDDDTHRLYPCLNIYVHDTELHVDACRREG